MPHTPGPWKMRRINDPDRIVIEPIKAGPPIAILFDYSDRSMSETLANAMMILSATEMLASLRLAEEALIAIRAAIDVSEDI